ncbi:MAG: glycosyltransferase family 9 protein [Limisphaerales bacterium]
MNNILVIRGGAIGDFILTMPVLSAVRTKFPNARIELLANPSIASLAIEFELADNVRDLGSLPFAPLFAENAKCSSEIVAWLSRFDLIISYAYDPDHRLENNLRRYSPAQCIAAPHRPDNQSTAHASVQLLEPLRTLIAFPFDVERWTLNVERSSFSSKIALHPGSGSPQKNWPEENWRSLLQHLISSTDDKILLIGGEAEWEILPRLAKLIPQNRQEIALDCPLIEVANRLKSCRIFIGHDSGITHLAAVLGLDCIVLWGPSNEQVWRPLGEPVQILRDGESLGKLPVKTVVEALNNLLTTT